MVADGEDVILLDTSQASETGEYSAYLLTVKYGEWQDRWEVSAKSLCRDVRKSKKAAKGNY